MNTDKIYAQNIANEYSPKQTSKVVALRKLDQAAKRPAKLFAYIFGSICSLILGTGMSFAMGVIGGGTPISMVIGIVVGLVGISGCAINYPIYKKMLAKGKAKYGSDIIRLANEIVDEQQ
ncbi:MAG: dihydropteridine reductase [Clostridia bacterium]|nr:dihydropteridine reductase [Clostridia bacterium]